MHRARALVLGPATTGQVAAHNRLERQDLGAAHEHRAPIHLRAVRRQALTQDLGKVVPARRKHMRAEDRGREQLKPELREAVQHTPLVGNPVLQDDIKRRNTVSRHEQKGAAVFAVRQLRIVDIAHFALRHKRQRQRGVRQRHGGRQALRPPPALYTGVAHALPEKVGPLRLRERARNGRLHDAVPQRRRRDVHAVLASDLDLV